MTERHNTAYEEALNREGITLIAGVDEAGRGPLAGPVVAAAVILRPGAVMELVDDSKKLTEKQRERALLEIKANALSIGIAVVSPEEIDRINIYRAARLAMISAIEKLDPVPEHLLIDQMPIELDIPSTSIIKGDSLSVSIAAASIVAKTTRDAYMREMDKVFPAYGFIRHKGYPTKEHLEALERHGPTPIHRKTFKPVKEIISRRP